MDLLLFLPFERDHIDLMQYRVLVITSNTAAYEMDIMFERPNTAREDPLVIFYTYTNQYEVI